MSAHWGAAWGGRASLDVGLLITNRRRMSPSFLVGMPSGSHAGAQPEPGRQLLLLAVGGGLPRGWAPPPVFVAGCSLPGAGPDPGPARTEGSQGRRPGRSVGRPELPGWWRRPSAGPVAGRAPLRKARRLRLGGREEPAWLGGRKSHRPGSRTPGVSGQHRVVVVGGRGRLRMTLTPSAARHVHGQDPEPPEPVREPGAGWGCCPAYFQHFTPRESTYCRKVRACGPLNTVDIRDHPGNTVVCAG